MGTADEGPPVRRGSAVRGLIHRLRAVMSRKRVLACQEMVELVTAYLDGALDARTQARFEEHLAQCDGCATYLEELRVTVHTLGTIRDEQLNPVFRARLLKAFAETAGSW